MNPAALCTIHGGGDELIIHRGEVILITGPIGSGKTQFLRRLAGITSFPASVSMKRHGATISRMLFDHTPPLWLAPTLEEELLFGLHPVPQVTEQRRVRSLWELDALPPDTPIETLDRLQSLQLTLAAMELANTNLALLDNPTASLPLNVAEMLRKDISEWVKRSGCAVVIACNRWQDWPSWVQRTWHLTVNDAMPKMENPYD